MFTWDNTYVRQIFLPIIWIFNEGEGDGIESRQPFKIFSTLYIMSLSVAVHYEDEPRQEKLGKKELSSSWGKMMGIY